MDVWLAVERSVEAFPAKEAIVEGEARLTYQELRDLVRSCAAGLQSEGVEARDRVVVIAENGIKHCIVTLACQALHAMSVHVLPRLKPAEARVFLDDAEPCLVLTTIDLGDLGASTLRLDRESEWTRLLGTAREPELPAPDETALSNMMYTSGTTGLPKGVPLTHRQTYQRALAGAVHTGVTSSDRILGAMPLFHQMGMIGNFLTAMILGATYHPVPRLQPTAVLDLIERETLTSFFGSPTHFALLAGEPSLPERDLGSFRKAAYGGGALRLNQLAFWNERLGTELVHVYGTSETMWTLINPLTRTRPEVTGRPGLHHWVRVVKLAEHDPAAIVAGGEEGELVVRVVGPGASEQCFAEYWRKPDAFTDSVVDGWYFTGDSVRRDAEGEYAITGRLKSVIRSAAEWIHPEEVELVLATHPAIADVAVVGVPDPVWGEAVSALVVARGQLTESEVEQFCRDHPRLAAYKRPRRVVFVDSIPRNVSGKLIRADAVAFFEHPASASPA